MLELLKLILLEHRESFLVVNLLLFQVSELLLVLVSLHLLLMILAEERSLLVLSAMMFYKINKLPSILAPHDYLLLLIIVLKLLLQGGKFFSLNLLELESFSHLQESKEIQPLLRVVHCVDLMHGWFRLIELVHEGALLLAVVNQNLKRMLRVLCLGV